MEERGTTAATLRNDGQPATDPPDDLSLLEMYRQMVLCRALDHRLWLLNRQGKAALVVPVQGHEAAQIGSAWALRRGQDLFFIYYRDLAVLLALGMTPREIMLGFLAKKGDPFSGARNLPIHGAHPKYGVFNLSNVVSTQIPQAVGAALASKMRGEDTVVIAYFGDGGASEGDCHEGMNFAAIHKLPVIFFCENNRYAISVPMSKQMAVPAVACRAQGYGMPGVVVDGCDVVAVYKATRLAAQRALDGEGPTFIEATVERYLPHTSDDDDHRYRTREEIEESRKRDPFKALQRRLRPSGLLTDEMDLGIHEAAKHQVDEATDWAEAAPYPGPKDFYDHVYSSPSDGIQSTCRSNPWQ